MIAIAFDRSFIALKKRMPEGDFTLRLLTAESIT
jgi:hypothetical protein